MIAQLLTAAALASGSPADAFRRPLDDADLALSVSRVEPIGFTTAPDSLFYGVNATLVRDQTDVWWADDGMLLIAAAVRPTPVPPLSLGFALLPGGGMSIRFNGSVSAYRLP